MKYELHLVLGLLFIGAALVPQLGASADGDFVVIVHRQSPLSTIRKSELNAVFLKKTTQWKDGVAIDPVDLSATSPVRAKFSQDVIGRSVQAVQAYWRKLIFSGQAVPPVELIHEGDILNYVGNRRGAIGYVSATTFIDAANVKKLTVINDRPDGQ